MVPLDERISLQRLPAFVGFKNKRDGFKKVNEDSNDGNDDNDISAIHIYRDAAERTESIKAENIKTGQILHSGSDAVDVIQRALNTLSVSTRGGIISISDGNYTAKSNNIFIPDINDLTIEGSSPSGCTIFDASNIETPNLDDPRYVGVFSRSTEDRRNKNYPLKSIKNLTIRNMAIIGSQTGKGYLADDLSIDGLRINNVDNLVVENIQTKSVGLSIECRNITTAIIRNCQSFKDAAGPTLSNNNKNIVVEDCYAFGSYDDSFACLGNIPTTSRIVFKNCIADKGLSPSSSVTASCFKIDSGGAEHGISGVTYINCKAYNAKPGRADIQGGFINGDPMVSNVKYINCSAINCHVGIKVAGSNMKVMSSQFQTSLLQNCDVALVTDVRSPGAQFQGISFVDNKQDTAFYTPAGMLTRRT
jgi:hypothetical protein